MRVEAHDPEVVGIDPDYPGLIQIHVYLEPTPDEHWAHFFRHPDGYGHPLSMHPPRLYVDRVEMHAPDGEIPKYMEKLHERIHCANEQHERDARPQLEAARQAQRTAEETARKRIADAKQALGVSD